MKLNLGFWKKRKYYLDKMSFAELVRAYFQYYAIQGYILVAVAGLAYSGAHFPGIGRSVAIIAAAGLAYPLVWYVLHRYVLHGTWLAKSPLTAPVWKRIHFDHHQDPHDLYVLFGALYTTFPAIAVATLPIGYLIAGWSGAALAVATGCLVTCFYEFCHCIEHLSFKPRNRWLLRMKVLHMAHHFHNEQGNYGITNFFWDRIFGTLYTNEDRPERSETVFNLGYDNDMAEQYPWVAALSGGVSNLTPRDRRQGGQA